MMKNAQFARRRRSLWRLVPTTSLMSVVVMCAGWLGQVAPVMSAAPGVSDQAGAGADADRLYRFAQAQARARGASEQEVNKGGVTRTVGAVGANGTRGFKQSYSPSNENPELAVPAIERLPLGQAAVGFSHENDVAQREGVAGADEAARSTASDGDEHAGSGLFSSKADGESKSDVGGIAKSGIADGVSWMFNTIGALGVVIGLILVFRAVLLRMNGQAAVGTARGAVEVLGRVSVAPRQHVLLLKVGQRVLLVGESANGLRTLDTIADPEEVADVLTRVASRQSNSATAGFSQMLSRFHGQFDESAEGKEEGGDSGEFMVDRARDQVMNVLGRVRSMQSQFRKGTV